MKKRIALLLVLAMTLSFTACRQPEDTASASAAASGYYPITVTDQAGREVTLEQEPQRIITAYYITSSLLMALDLDERIVGIENDPQKRAIYGLALNYCESLLLLSQGRVLGMLHPRTNTLETTEQMLSRVYGPVSLQYVAAKNGSRQLTMINEDTL